jgi:DNA-directed RNA polymerase subunit alpha
MRIRWRDFELPSAVVHQKDSATDRFGKFVIEPFERGFGHTIGNGLRRVLLGSIEGTAVTAVEIDGVEHEFKSVPGVLEDVMDIVIACKRLRVHAATAAMPATLTIDKKGEGPVTAADIQCPAGVELVDKSLPICTLTSPTAKFSAKFTVRRGRGYTAAEDTGELMDQIGLIPLDAAYSPVIRVRYSVEATRVGKFTNYDRLVLEVWTDGTVRPEMALVEAAKIYRKHLNPFVQFSEVVQGVPIADDIKPIDAAAERKRDRVHQLLAEPVERLDLSTRARNCLEIAQIQTLGELVFRSPEELLGIKNLGQTVLTEIEKKLAELNLSVGMNREEVLGSGK